MKYLLFAMVALLSFLIALAGAFFVDPRTNMDSLTRLTQPEPPRPPAAAPAQDPAGVLAQELRRKEEELQERTRALADREAQLDQRERELGQLRADLESIRAQITGHLEEAEVARQERLQTVAHTLSAMRPQNAAASLEGMPEEDIAAILSLVNQKDRGRIMDAMNEQRFGDLSTRVLRAIQDQRL